VSDFDEIVNVAHYRSAVTPGNKCMGIQERKEREKERRRQQIIVAAKRVFSERGFN
jgi:hypothetical protein